MKSLEEIRNEVTFAIENKKITGIIKDDELILKCPSYNSPIVYSLITLPFVIIGVLAFFAYIGIKLRYVYWIPICYVIFVVAIVSLSKDYLIFNFNKLQIYLLTKFDKTTIWKGYYLSKRDFLEIGIDNEYSPTKRNNALIQKSDSEIFENDFNTKLVYLANNGAKKTIINYIKNKEDIDNISTFCNLLGSVLEIPCKSCQKTQKLEVIKDIESHNSSFNIIPINLKTEKWNYIKLIIRLSILRFLIAVILPMEIVLYMEYGFIGSLKAWNQIFYIFIKKLFFE